MILCYYTLILLALHCVLASLLWTVVRKIPKYGETLTLMCHVPNCCSTYAGWDLFDRDGIRHTLFIDVKSHRPVASAKYDGEVKTDVYTLDIRSLTKQDVNVSYACIYGSTIGDPLILLEKDVFEECIPCLYGSYRNTSGCGPCQILQTTSLVPFVSHSDAVERHTSKSTSFIIAQISSSTVLPFHVNPQKSGEEADLLVFAMVILVVFVILLSVVIIVICVKRSGFVLTGICWTHGNTQPENEDLRQNDFELEEIWIKHENNNANIEPVTDCGYSVADYLPKETSYQDTTLFSKYKVLQESLDSGCHAVNISDIVVERIYADHKSSCDSVFHTDNTDMYASNRYEHNFADSLISSVSSINDETKSEQECLWNIPKLSMDFSGINYNTTDNLNLSATCMPVTTDTEPHTFQLFTANVQEHQGETSGYQTQSEQDAVLPSKCSQSGEYMSMNVSTLNSRRDNNETILSHLENFNFEIKSLQRNNSNIMSGKSETDMKHCGSTSVDSEVLTYKNHDLEEH